jgi:lysophospholipase L1-like esterase
VKLCYVDFNTNSDAQAIAKTYVSTIKKLQEANPATRVIAVTAPLTAIRGGPKEWVKQALGRSTDSADNAKRKEFNDYLRKQFDSSHLFDIAKLESDTAGTETESLRLEITNDGGHLNDKGQREIGAAFIRLVAGN